MPKKDPTITATKPKRARRKRATPQRRRTKKKTVNDSRTELWDYYAQTILDLKVEWNRRSRTSQGVVYCNRQLQTLLNSTRNSRIRIHNEGQWNQAYKVVPDPTQPTSERVYPGLHNFMKSRFYPDQNMRFPDKNRKPQKWKPSSQKRTCQLYGKEHGSLVHNQMELFTQQMITSDTRPCREPYVDPCTIRILNVFEQKKWLPICSEVPIFDESLKVATSIDLIALDTVNEQVILIELKTNYESESYYPLESDACMPKPLSMFKNCPLTRHMLQLALMKLILAKKYSVEVDRSFIVQSRSKSCDVKLMDLSGWENRSGLLEQLYEELRFD